MSRILDLKKDVVFLNSELIKVTKTNADMYVSWTSNKGTAGHVGRKQGGKNTAIKRVDNLYSLRRSFKRMRDIINCNFTGADNELFLTLTYQDPSVKGVAGAKRVARDFDIFVKKIRYHYSDQIKWVCALEPTSQGRWHMHVLLKFISWRQAFLHAQQLQDLWGHGFVKINRIHGVSNVGAYLTAYLTNVIVDPNAPATATRPVSWTRRHEHMVEKGKRLEMYPAGVKVCRHSQNCATPSSYYVRKDQLAEMVEREGWQVTATKSFTVETDQLVLNPATNQLEPFTIEVKQAYFVRSEEVAEKAKILRQLPKAQQDKLLQGRSVAAFLQAKNSF